MMIKDQKIDIHDQCEHCQGSGVGWDHEYFQEITGGCSRCNGTGKNKKKIERDKIIAIALESPEGKKALAEAMVKPLGNIFHLLRSLDTSSVKADANKHRLKLAKEKLGWEPTECVWDTTPNGERLKIRERIYSSAMEFFFLDTQRVRMYRPIRMTGISTMIVIDALTYAMTYPGSKVLIVSPYESNTGYLQNMLTEYLETKLFYKSYRKTRDKFSIPTHANSSSIRFTTSPSRLIGTYPDRILVDMYDEFAPYELSSLSDIAKINNTDIGFFSTYDTKLRPATDEDIRKVQEAFTNMPTDPLLTVTTYGCLA